MHCAVTNQSMNKKLRNPTKIHINKESWFWNSHFSGSILKLTLYFPRSNMIEYTACSRKLYWQELCWQQWLAGDRVCWLCPTCSTAVIPPAACLEVFPNFTFSLQAACKTERRVPGRKMAFLRVINVVFKQILK